jgi:hypothetical protein
VQALIEHAPAAPPTQPRDVDEVDLLLRFVHERDVRCARCDYNLRNLTQPVCPECNEQLQLAVGLRRPRFGLLIIALAPSVFSGIAASLLAAVIITVTVFARAGPPPWPLLAADIFGFASGTIGLALFVFRWRFLKQSFSVQAALAAGWWFIHITAFLTFVLLMR